MNLNDRKSVAKHSTYEFFGDFNYIIMVQFLNNHGNYIYWQEQEPFIKSM